MAFIGHGPLETDQRLARNIAPGTAVQLRLSRKRKPGHACSTPRYMFLVGRLRRVGASMKLAPTAPDHYCITPLTLPPPTHFKPPHLQSRWRSERMT